ncbi:MAG TPA: hypothetical protein VGB53_02165 [Rubricoccaceae bacterium]|jgi:hypothetical protein
MPDTPKAPAQNQQSDAIDAADTSSGSTVSTPDTDGARVAEAGNGYVGRTMDDSLKTNPRVRGDGEVNDAPADEASTE